MIVNAGLLALWMLQTVLPLLGTETTSSVGALQEWIPASCPPFRGGRGQNLPPPPLGRHSRFGGRGPYPPSDGLPFDGFMTDSPRFGEPDMRPIFRGNSGAADRLAPCAAPPRHHRRISLPLDFWCQASVCHACRVRCLELAHHMLAEAVSRRRQGSTP